MFTHTLMSGISHLAGHEKSIPSLCWNQHPKFEGIAMKNIIAGEETNGQISVHLVRIEPGAAIGGHVHASQWELHQVLEGAGRAKIGKEWVPYAAGTLSVVPVGKEHEVVADGEGMLLLATFSPPLA